MSAPRNIVAAVKHLNMTEELNFKFHLIFVNLSLSSHIFTSQNCSTFFIFVSVSTPWQQMFGKDWMVLPDTCTIQFSWSKSGRSRHLREGSAAREYSWQVRKRGHLLFANFFLTILKTLRRIRD